MAIIVTPEQAKPIPDFSPGVFDGDSLLLQTRNGDDTRVDGDQVANYVAEQKTYTDLGGLTIPQAIARAGAGVVKIPGTLLANTTTVTITDARILADSFITVWSPVPYESAVQSVGSVELTFPAQSANMNFMIKVD